MVPHMLRILNFVPYPSSPLYLLGLVYIEHEPKYFIHIFLVYHEITHWARGESNSRSLPCEGNVLPFDHRPRTDVIKDLSYLINAMAYYTGAGDTGCTGTFGCTELSKSDKLVVALGDLDELGCAIGVAITTISDKHISDMLVSVQNNLFVIGSELAASVNEKGIPKARITGEKVKELEAVIDEIGSTLPKLDKFVLPGGSVGGANLQLARAICRRAERSIVGAGSEAKVSEALLKYINRLSSFLFVAALHVNKKEGVDELNPVY